MAKCILRSHHNTYQITTPRGDDAENLYESSVELDSHYDSCCSKIFRPGCVLHKLIVGLLVVLGIAVVIAVIFVVCIFFVPSDKQKEIGNVLGKGEAFRRKEEINRNVMDIIEYGHTDGHDHDVKLTGESTRYDTDKDLPKHNHQPEFGEFSGFSQYAVPTSEPFETATKIELASEPQDFFGFLTFTPLEDLSQPFDETTEVSFDEPTAFSIFDVVPSSDCELTCLDGTCITVEQLNNGVTDCPDGTDERNMSK